MPQQFTPDQINTARAIEQVYQKYGLDPSGGIAVGFGESNMRSSALQQGGGGGVGVFQDSPGGALTGHNTAWAQNPINEATQAAQALVAAGGRGLSGPALQALQVKVFEKPTSPTNDLNPAHYAQALQLMKAAGGANAGTLAAAGAAAQNAVNNGSGSATPTPSPQEQGTAALAGFAPTNAAERANPGGYAGSDMLTGMDLMTGAAFAKAGTSAPAVASGMTAGAAPAAGAPATPNAQGLVSPFAPKTVHNWAGTDYGVDFTYGNAKTPTQAMASGTVARIGSGWNHTAGPFQSGAAVWIKLDHPIAGQPYMYYAEGIPNVKVGQRIGAGQNVMYDTGEMGIAPNPNVSTAGHTHQPSGVVMNKVLAQFGLNH